jgi:murein DD-endopeptidase MepM/ murein hydrolase activator NlpD
VMHVFDLGQLGRGTLAAALALGACTSPAPDVGPLPELYAKPAEEIHVFELQQNQTFGEVLDGLVGSEEQYALLLAFREQANPRRMRAGTEITLRFLPEGRVLRGVDIVMSSDETVRINRSGSGWRSSTVETPVYVDTLFASGEVETALWNSVMGNERLADMPRGDRAAVIDHLDRVFQWQMDWSRQIRVGDTYRLAFEREVRPDGSMRSGRLLAAEYNNAGTAYHAIWFDPNGDGQGSYFDLDGKSVRRAFLLKPLQYRRISSRFTTGRFHPILQRWRAHRGIDYAADAGTPVMATSDGVVIHRGPKGQLGNTVEIRHPNGFVTRYGHLQSFRRGVTAGTRVHQSDIVGYVGMTGLATGPHLHYEMLRSGRQVDPLAVDLPVGDPVPEDDMVRWRGEMTTRVALLGLVPRAGPVRTAEDDATAPEAGADDTGG